MLGDELERLVVGGVASKARDEDLSDLARDTTPSDGSLAQDRFAEARIRSGPIGPSPPWPRG